MAEKSSQFILEALSQAVLRPEGTAVHGNKSTPGLFPATAAGKQAAQRCKDEELLRIVRTETKGKATFDMCVATEKGLAHFLKECSPKQVLEDFVRTLEGRQSQLNELVATARQTHLGMEALRLVAQQVLEQLHGKTLPGIATAPTTMPSQQVAGFAWQNAALQLLTRWQAAGSSEDCPLPSLYRQMAQACPGLSVGQFHDGLRVLHEKSKIYLHPWTGPLYDMPEPTCALLIGHEVLYYASLRQPQHRPTLAPATVGAEQAFSYEYSAAE